MSDKLKLTGVKGMNDILPADAPLWELFENTVASVLKSYGFQQIRTPILEPTALFARGLGNVTDIVEKEMYTFLDALNGDSLTLRPESTASVVRSAIEHNLTYDGPKRLWYSGPMFRHERPQRGRYRQFHQVGAECLGFNGADSDAELILLCQRLWDDLGLQNIRLELNSIGDTTERQAHRADLIAYFIAHENQLDEDARRRLHTNPLRILDTKNSNMQDLVNGAPKLIDYLGEDSRRHFEELQEILRHNGIVFSINPRLVRGMDYYNRTVFEWITDELGAQGTICGGGRYDSLIEMMGGKPTPACGFAMGVERILELMKSLGDGASPNQCDVYLMHQGKNAQLCAFALAEKIRDVGLDVILHCQSLMYGAGLKTQMKKADASGATFALILGEEEAQTAEVTVKLLRSQEREGNQVRIQQEQVVEYLINEITGKNKNLEEDHPPYYH